MERKLILVPKDKEAQIALNHDTATPSQLMELPLTQAEFKALVKTGFFDLINNIAGVNIDDYEDCLPRPSRYITWGKRTPFLREFFSIIRNIAQLDHIRDLFFRGIFHNPVCLRKEHFLFASVLPGSIILYIGEDHN